MAASRSVRLADAVTRTGKASAAAVCGRAGLVQLENGKLGTAFRITEPTGLLPTAPPDWGLPGQSGENDEEIYMISGCKNDEPSRRRKRPVENREPHRPEAHLAPPSTHPHPHGSSHPDLLRLWRKLGNAAWQRRLRGQCLFLPDWLRVVRWRLRRPRGKRQPLRRLRNGMQYGSAMRIERMHVLRRTHGLRNRVHQHPLRRGQLRSLWRSLRG